MDVSSICYSFYITSISFGSTNVTLPPSILVDEGKEVPGTFLYYWVDSARTPTLASVQNAKNLVYSFIIKHLFLVSYQAWTITGSILRLIIR